MPLGGWLSIGTTVAGGVMGAESSKSAQKDAESAKAQQLAEIQKQRSEGEAFIKKEEERRKPYQQMVNDYLFSDKADVKTANTIQRQASSQLRNINRGLASAYNPALAASATRGIGYNVANSLTAAQINEDQNRLRVGMQVGQQVDPLLQARLALSGQTSGAMQGMYAQDYSANMNMAQAGAAALSNSINSLAKTDFSKVSNPFGSMGGGPSASPAVSAAQAQSAFGTPSYSTGIKPYTPPSRGF